MSNYMYTCKDLVNVNDLKHSQLTYTSNRRAHHIYTNELTHYGVIGMKWGIRRASKKGTSYTYKSHGQKKWEKRYNKAVSKGKKEETVSKAKSKLDVFKERDRNRQDYAKTTSVGKSFAKTLLMGPIGNGSYNRYRASGDTRVASFLKSNIVVSTLGAPVNIMLSRGSEFKSARMQSQARKYRDD